MHREPLGAVLRGGLAHFDGRAVYSLAGELDLAGADAFQERMSSLIDAGHPVDLDLSALDFIDSTGIRSLLMVLGAASSRSLEIRLLDPQPSVRRALELVGVLGLFEWVGG